MPLQLQVLFGLTLRLLCCWACSLRLTLGVVAAATRAGILYISESNQWCNMVESWVKRVGG